MTNSKRRMVVLHERSNPSTAYFVEPFAVHSGCSVEYFDFRQTPDPMALRGASVVVVRYLAARWKAALEAARCDMEGFSYFFDDDVWCPATWTGLPLRYRWKLWRLAFRHQEWFRRNDASIWTSNQYLSEKYADAGFAVPLTIPMRSPMSDCWQEVGTAYEPSFFYHGSASHESEARWLMPIVKAVLQRRPDVRFEIIASRALARDYARIPGVRVVPPMDWNAFLAFCRRSRRAIGLAPVLDRTFNRARSPVKFIDIARAGGVGVYSSGSIFDECVTHGHDGYLLPNEHANWIDAILALLGDPGRVSFLHRNAVSRVQGDFGVGR